MRTLHNPSAGTTIVGILKPHEGGSGQVTGSTALNAMAAIALAAKNQATGVAGLDKDGRVSASVISPELFSTVSINGPKSVNKGSDTVYTIRNYDSFSEYAISSTLGTVSAVDDLITYSAPSVVGEAGFFVNGREFKIQVIDTAPATPTITSPVNLSNLTTTGYTFTTSAYSVPDAASTHASTDWWLSTRPDFSDTVARVNDSATDKTTWTVNGLTDGQTYYVNARHKSSSGIYSEWSPGVSFTVSVPMPATPTVTSHVNNGTVYQGNQTFTSSAYNITGNASPHLTSDWQLSVVSDFSTIYASAIESSGNLLTWAVTGLADGGTFYLRVRHKATNGKSSNWSTPIRINVLYAFVYNSIVSTSSNNFNMKSAAIASGWNQTMPLFMEVTLAAGAVIGSSNTSGYAFDTGSGFPAGTTLKLTVNSGATIAGAGGNASTGAGVNGANGGPALIARAPLTISNTGVIGGGGGGGGSGAPGVYMYYNVGEGADGSPVYNYNVGGGGGGGQGSVGGLGGPTVGSGTGPFNYYRNADSGAAGTISGPGSRGLGSWGHFINVAPNTYIEGGHGGSGGGLGQPGSSGGNAAWGGQDYNGGAANSVTTSTSPFADFDDNASAPTAGGLAGAAIQGNSFITWNSTGTRLGQIT